MEEAFGTRNTVLPIEKQQEYEKRIVGQKTSTGTEIKGFTVHAFDRLTVRVISPERILNMLAQTPEISKSDLTCDVYKADGSGIVINRNTGYIVTVEFTRRKPRR